MNLTVQMDSNDYVDWEYFMLNMVYYYIQCCEMDQASVCAGASSTCVDCARDLVWYEKWFLVELLLLTGWECLHAILNDSVIPLRAFLEVKGLASCSNGLNCQVRLTQDQCRNWMWWGFFFHHWKTYWFTVQVILSFFMCIFCSPFYLSVSLLAWVLHYGCGN